MHTKNPQKTYPFQSSCNPLDAIRDLKIDDAANLDGAVLKCINKKSFLKCGNCNKRLKFILVACKHNLFG